MTHLLTDTVTYADVSSRGGSGGSGGSGDPVYGSQSTAAARVEHGLFRVMGATGETVDAKAKVVTEADIPHQARLWLPGDDTAVANDARQIIGRKEASTPDSGLTLRELYL